MTQLFHRDYEITLGTTDIKGLACAFKVKKTLKSEPNTATIKVWNLSDATRDLISQPKKAVPVRIEAGYKGDTAQIYLGELRSGTSEISGADIVTTLTSGDKEKSTQQSRIHVPIGAKTSADQALLAIARTFKDVGLGNATKMAAKLATKGLAIFPVATVLTGNSARTMTDFCRSAGLEWSIQDGKFQILDLNKALEERPFILSSESGLIGSPTQDSDGSINFTTLMIPNIRPGMRVQLDSVFVKGLYRIQECEYSGDTWGNEWDIKISAKPPKA